MPYLKLTKRLKNTSFLSRAAFFWDGFFLRECNSPQVAMDIAWRAQRRARSKGESVGDANQTRREFFFIAKDGG